MTSQIYSVPKGYFKEYFEVNPDTGASACHHPHASLKLFQEHAHKLDLQELQWLLMDIHTCPFNFETRPRIVRQITASTMNRNLMNRNVIEAKEADTKLMDRVKAVIDQRLAGVKEVVDQEVVDQELAPSGNSCCLIL